MLWLLLVILLACSASVSASETVLFGLNRQTLLSFSTSPKRGKRAAYQLMQHPRRVLMTVLLSNTAVNVSIFTVSFFALRPLRDSLGYGAAAVNMLVPAVVIICGEMIPKAIALSNAQQFATVAAGLVTGLQVGLGPIRWLMARWVVDPVIRLVSPTAPSPDVVSTEELRLLVKHSAKEGVISSDENDMLQAIVALEDVSVREVMTPRVDIRFIDIASDHLGALATMRESKRRRLPVRGRDLDDIRGVLYVRDLFFHPDESVESITRRIHFVPEQVNLMQLLHHFREEKIHMAVVVDEFGGTAGLVTSEDVIEWIVGDLPDSETPSPTEVTEQIDENTFRLAGDLSARVWADRFRVGEFNRQVDTVGGLILAKLGRWPRVGDSVRIQNLTLTVEQMQRRRIERVLLHYDPDATASPASRTQEGNTQ